MQSSQTQSEDLVESFPANCAVLAGDGTIIAVNGNWRRFGAENGMRMADMGIGVNYLAISRIALGREHPLCLDLESLLAGRTGLVNFCYPCHDRNTRRWFNLLATRMHDPERNGVALLAHIDISRMIEGGIWPEGLVVETSRALTRPISFGRDPAEPQPMQAIGLTSHLTTRQAQVLTLVLNGSSNKAIAAELDISISAVKKHVATLLDLAGADNRRDLILKFRGSRQGS